MSLIDKEILGRYMVRTELGSGGMGTVYLAFDNTLQRDVAIKVLNESSVEDSANVDRFKREVKAVAGLTHSNVIGLYDFAEENDQFFAVMEYVKGKTLDEYLDEQAVSREEAMTIAAGMAKGLSAAHKAGIVHRDIKPSNVMITEDNEVKLLDFGLATARKTIDFPDETMSAADVQTKIGTIMGTVGYMSPEQVRGRPSDKRSDIFSFGTVVYEMLTGHRAFKRESTIDTMSAILNETVPSLDLEQLPTSDPLFGITQKCLEKVADDRYQDVSEILEDLNDIESKAVLSSSRPAASRNKVFSFAALGIAVIAAAVVLFTNTDDTDSDKPGINNRSQTSDTDSGTTDTEQIAEARQVLFPRMLNLVNQGQFLEAYEIGVQIKDYFEGEEAFQVAWENVAPLFSITSDPPGATVFFGDYGTDPSTFKELGKTPIENVRLSTSIKQFIFKLDGHLDAVAVSDNSFFQAHTEIDRTLFSSADVPEGMIHISEGKGFRLTGMVFDISNSDGFAPTVGDFLIDRFEVTNAQYKAFLDDGGYTNQDNWTDPFMSDGTELNFEAAMELLIDTTGRPGPSTWAVGRFPDGMDNYPVQGVSWYEARAYAKWAGKSLPTLYHWSRANATNFGSEFVGQLIKLSNINKGSYSEVGSNLGVSRFGVSDLCGNVAEWATNAVGEQRLSLGGSTKDQEYFFNQANPVNPWNRSEKRGFRCIKEQSEQLAELYADVELQYRDYSDAEPVSDEVFEVYRSQFDYDDAPLDAVINYRDEEQPDYIKERVEFNTVYDGERMIAYLYLPRNVKPPYQSVVFFHGAAAIVPVASESRQDFLDILKFIPQSGRALVVPVLKGQWDRNDGLKTWASNDSQQYADFLIKWTKDYRRTLDYLESREDIDNEKFCYLGASWGAFNLLITAAVEPRINLAIGYVGGLSMTPAKPQVDQINFVRHVKQPTLWLVGEYDQIFPLKHSAEPAFNNLGTDATDKRLVVYPTEHSLPKNERIHETLDWLDKYFGPAQ